MFQCARMMHEPTTNGGHTNGAGAGLPTADDDMGRIGGAGYVHREEARVHHSAKARKKTMREIEVTILTYFSRRARAHTHTLLIKMRSSHLAPAINEARTR